MQKQQGEKVNSENWELFNEISKELEGKMNEKKEAFDELFPLTRESV